MPQHSQLPQVLEEQARNWRQNNPIHVETLLDRYPALRSQRDAVLDLLYQEIVLREQRGEKPRLEDYAARFPELTEDLRLQFEVDDALAPETAIVNAQSPKPPTGSFRALSQSGHVRPSLPGYEVFETLGRGGIGVVYKARQMSLNRMVALKIMLAGAHASTHELARFRSEAEAVARFQHPNIVQVYEFGIHEGRPFIALEMLESSLTKKLAGTPVPARQAAQWLETLAKAVHYAHQHGIVHRDLKPGNVLISRDGVLKITDFGMAKVVAGPPGAQSHSNAIMGTPSYMAPEQTTGRSRDIGPATDVYGLGSILYELLTGRPPFRAKTVAEILEQVRNHDPAPPSRHRSSVPRDLETICLTCLQKDPARRYANAQALAGDLGAFLAGKPIQSRRPGLPERLLQWVRRRPAESVLVVAASLILMGLVAGTIWLHALAVAVTAGSCLLIGSWLYSASLRRAMREMARQQAVAERNVERLRLVLEMARMLMNTASLEELLLVLAETTARLTDAELATIYLVDHDKRELWSKVTLDEGVGEIRLPLGKGIAGSVAASGEPVNIADAYSDTRFDPTVDRRTGHKTKNVLTAPITAENGTILGVFQVINKHDGTFGIEDIEMLSSLAASASISIEHAFRRGQNAERNE